MQALQTRDGRHTDDDNTTYPENFDEQVHCMRSPTAYCMSVLCLCGDQAGLLCESECVCGNSMTLCFAIISLS